LALSFKHLILPELHIPHTELLDLEPLPVAALHNAAFEKLYPFTHFNPIQTQVRITSTTILIGSDKYVMQLFHTLVHTDHNVLLGAPTGSGKTITAELAMFRLFNCYPKLKVESVDKRGLYNHSNAFCIKVVYIAPLKALVRERMKDWNNKFVNKLGKNMVELTGDFTPDVRFVIITHSAI